MLYYNGRVSRKIEESFSVCQIFCRCLYFSTYIKNKNIYLLLLGLYKKRILEFDQMQWVKSKFEFLY